MSNSQVVLDDIGGTGVFSLLAETFGARRGRSAKARAPAAPATEAVAVPSGFTATLRLMPEAAAPVVEAPASPTGFTTTLGLMPQVEAAPAAPELSAFPSATGFTAALRLLTEAEARSADSAVLRSAPMVADAAGTLTFSRGKVALWTGAGYIGVAALMAGAAQLVQGAADPVQSVMATVIGGIVAAVAWRHAWSLMTDDGAPSVLNTPPYVISAGAEEAAEFAPFQAPRREDIAAALR